LLLKYYFGSNSVTVFSVNVRWIWCHIYHLYIILWRGTRER